MTDADWPKPLTPVDGPFAAEKLAGSAAGMGTSGPVTCSLIDDGFVPPDLICGMTLFLLARQPRSAKPDGAGPKRSGTPITGGVWVREQFVTHRPLPGTERFTVTGESTGQYVRKGRRYGTNRSHTVGPDGSPVATNLTTGLLSYRAEPGAEDDVIGIPLADTPSPEPDWSAADNNPHLTELQAATVGRQLGGDPVTVSLAMMAARDTATPDNAIHSDLAEAKKAGLERPIAGGSHVLSFGLEPILAEFGPHALHHGALIDARWRAPTHCDVDIIPTATITAADPDRVVIDLAVVLSDGPSATRSRSTSTNTTAMVGTVTIPLPTPGS